MKVHEVAYAFKAPISSMHVVEGTQKFYHNPKERGKEQQLGMAMGLGRGVPPDPRQGEKILSIPVIRGE